MSRTRAEVARYRLKYPDLAEAWVGSDFNSPGVDHTFRDSARVKIYRNTIFNAFSRWAGCIVFFCFIETSLTLVAPPHLLACPGAQDGGSQRFCQTPGNIHFLSQEVSVDLNDGFVTLWAVRHGGAFGSVIASFNTVGSPLSDLYFVRKSGNISWDPFDASPKSISISLTNNSNSSSYSTPFRVNLRVISPSALISLPASETVVTILDTRISTGTINFASLDDIVVPSDTVGTISVLVSRAGGAGCNASVVYQTIPVPGFDYGHYGGQLRNYGQISWSEGDYSNRTVLIQIIPTSNVQTPPEQFYIELVRPVCAPLAPTYRRISVTILNRNVPGVLILGQVEFSVSSGLLSSVVSIPVNREGGSAGAVSVEYSTVQSSAIAGVHYTSKSGLLIWPASDAGTRHILVTILPASVSDPNPQTQFVVRLRFVAATTIQGPSFATIIIQNTLLNYGLLGFQQELECMEPSPTRNCLYVIQGTNRDAILVVLRRGGSQGAVSAGFRIDIGNSDILPQVLSANNLSGTLTWTHLDTAPKSVVLPLSKLYSSRNDTWQAARVTLFNPDQNARNFVDSSRAEISVIFVTRDSGGFFTVSSLNVSLTQSGSSHAYFLIRRSNFAVGNATIFYETVSNSYAINEIACDGVDCNLCEGLSSAYPGQSCNLTFSPFLNAVEGQDFVPVSGNVSWDSGDTADRIVRVQILNDFIYSYQVYFKYFALRLIHVLGPSVHEFAIDANHQEAIACISDDNARTGYFLFENTEFDTLSKTILSSGPPLAVSEGNLTFNITVNRKGGNSGNVSLSFRTIQNPEQCSGLTCSAIAGKHFLSTHGQLEWYEGDQTSRTITVQILEHPGWNSSIAFRDFQVSLENITFFSGRQKARTYSGPQQVLASVKIEESDGPGIASLDVTHTFVREDVGTVGLKINRLGGLKTDLNILYSTNDATAETAQRKAGDLTRNFPLDCRNQNQSGITRVIGAAGIREVFCDMTDEWGSASIFLWDSTKTMLWDRQCIPGAAAGGFALSQDLAARLSMKESPGTGSFMRWQHGMQDAGVDDLVPVSLRPVGAGEFARPVSFPLNNRTVWFDWQNRLVLWGNASSLYNFSFDEMEIDGSGGMDDTQNEFYFISDGVNTVHVGCLNITSKIDPTRNSFNFSGVDAMYGSSQRSSYLDSSEWTILVQENQDDAYVRIPDFGFDFVWTGVNYRSTTFIGSNGYITFGQGSNEYSNISLWNPPLPSLHFGSADNSWQFVGFRRVSESGIQGCVVRFEGTASLGGTLSKPNIIAEISFFADGRIRLVKALHLNALSSKFFVTDGKGQLLIPVTSVQNQTLILWTKRAPKSGPATVIRFDFAVGRIDYKKVKPLAIDENSACRLKGGSFGHQLWTVNGRVMYRDCTLNEGSSSLHVVHGGTLLDPNRQRDSVSFEKCPASLFEKCNGWDLQQAEGSSGLTLFASVDSSGFLYFGDIGSAYSGGTYQCSSHQFGVSRAGIELGLSIHDDYVPISGTLVWSAGDSTSKFINISIKNDGMVDHNVIETFVLELNSDSDHSAVNLERSLSFISILDLDGPGLVSVDVDPGYPSPVAERGYCCQKCSDSGADDSRYCTYWIVKRSSGRGPVCVDASTLAGKTGTPVLNAVPLIHFFPKNETICWDHEEIDLKRVSTVLKNNRGYDILLKSFNLTLSPTSLGILDSREVNGSTYWSAFRNLTVSSAIGNQENLHSGAVIGIPALVSVYDEDAQAGLVTFSADSSTGNTIFSFSYDHLSASLLVQRFGSKDTDISVHFSTGTVPDNLKKVNSTSSRIPIAMSVVDGSNGSNILCSASQALSGDCFQSSSNLQCDQGSGRCTFLITVHADSAVSGDELNMPPQFSESNETEYLSSSGVLEWQEGDNTPRGISIPIFHPSHAQKNFGALYRAFSVNLFNLTSSLFQNGKRVVLNTLIHLPPTRFFEECNTCPHIDGIFRSPGTKNLNSGFCQNPVCPCEYFNCRNSTSSSAIVVFPVLFNTPGSFRLVNTTYFISENISTGQVKYVVQRIGGYLGPVSVNFESFGLEINGFSVAAMPMVDAEFSNGTLKWLSNDMRDQEIVIPIINDKRYLTGRLKKSFMLRLVKTSFGADIANEFSSVTQIIVDDDPVVGEIVFQNSLISVNELSGMANVSIARIGGNDTDVYVRVSTSNAQFWDPVQDQTDNSNAFPSYLVDQSYSCYSTTDGQPAGSFDKVMAVFDFNTSTFIDSEFLPTSTAWISYQFSNCKLSGNSITSYTFFTFEIGPCPRHWIFEGSADNLVWVKLNEVQNGSCTPAGNMYAVEFEEIGRRQQYRSYRWTFLADTFGGNRVALSEISLGFYHDVGLTHMIPAAMCNNSGTCCSFQGAVCDPSTGHTLMLRNSEYDYKYQVSLLHWKDGEAGVKFFTFPIYHDFLGCTEKTCPFNNQFNDRPYEDLAVRLNHPFALDTIGTVIPWSEGAIDLLDLTIPYTPRPLLDNTSATVRILDEDGPGIITLFALSCGVRGGYSVPEFISRTGFLEGGYDASCPILETASLVGFMVTRTGMARGFVSVDYSIEHLIDLSPVQDVVPRNGTLVWAHGDSSPKYFSVLIRPSTGYTVNFFSRPFKVKLSNLRGGAALRPCMRAVDQKCVDPEKDSVVVTVVDVDAVPGMIKILNSEMPSSEQYPIDIAQGYVNISILRIGGSDLPLNIFYATEVSSTSTFGSPASECFGAAESTNCQYWPLHGSLQWEDGSSTTQVVQIKLNQHSTASENSTFRFRIWGSVKESQAFCGGYDGNVPESNFVNLLCDVTFSDQVTVTVSFRKGGNFGLIPSLWPYAVVEGQEVKLAVNRTMSFIGAAFVEYQTYGGTALPSVHYLAAQKRLSWTDGDESLRIISVSTYQILPENAIVDFYVRLTLSSANSIILRDQQLVRVVIHGQSASYTPQFTACDVSESTTAKSELNTISFMFTVNAYIGPFATITISGLTGTLTATSKSLPISGQSAGVFGNISGWNQDLGILNLTIPYGQFLTPQNIYRFSLGLKNPASSGRSKQISIKIKSVPVCSQTFLVGLSCPETITIDSAGSSLAITKSFILQASSDTFSKISVTSHLCLYFDCPHAPYFGARNFLIISMQPESTIPAFSSFTLSGMGQSSTKSANLTVRLVNVSSTDMSQARSTSAVCKCTWENCGCSHMFSGIPRVSGAKLQIRVQCNYLGRALQAAGDKALIVRVGSDHTYTHSSGLNFNSSCIDQCGESQALFHPELNVGELVTETGLLFISISTQASVDFCQEGNFLRADLTLSWTTESLDIVDLDGHWNQNAGTLIFSLQQPYSISSDQRSLIIFALENPVNENSGSSLVLQVTTADATKAFGPSIAQGSVLGADRSPRIRLSSIEELSPVKGASNFIQFHMLFNGPVGGLEGGFWVDIVGLKGSETPDTDFLPILECTSCETLSKDSSGISISSLIGDVDNGTVAFAGWKQAAGHLRFFLRGLEPTYLIPEQIMTGSIMLTNGHSDFDIHNNISVFIAGEPVFGAADFPANVMRAGGCGSTESVLGRRVSTDFFAHPILNYSEPTAYMPPAVFNLSFELLQTLQPSDIVIVRAPTLTTCSLLCLNGSCEYKASSCSDIGPVVLPSNVSISDGFGSPVSGLSTHVFLFSWNESKRELQLIVREGRSLKKGHRIQALIQLDDFDCAGYECALKLIPHTYISTLSNIYIELYGCALDNRICPTARQALITEQAVSRPGANWAQYSLLTSDSIMNITGRVWFAAQVHREILYLIGGVSASGFEKSILRSSDGSTWSRIKDAAPVSQGRVSFPSASYKESIWIFGGRTEVPQVLMNDVWKSETGDIWCVATRQAGWSARWNHASLVHADKLWILGGTSLVQNESDVWHSSDGVEWKVATDRAAFSSRSRFSAASFRSRMWVFGGDISGNCSGVWFSYDGIDWFNTKSSLPWTNRQLHDGLVFHNKMWVVGSLNNASERDIWFTFDGENWKQATSWAQFGKRLGYSAVTFRNSMWVIGGALESCDSSDVSGCLLSAPSNDCEKVGYVGFFSSESCRLSDAWINTFFDANFMVLDISSSCDVYGTNNKLNVVISLDSDMEIGSSLVINGLDAYDRRGMSPEIYVYGISSYHFNHVGYWRNSTSAGSILLIVQQQIFKGKIMNFSMLFPNLEFNPTLRKLSVVASSIHFQQIEQYAWSYQSSTTLPMERKGRLFANPVVNQPVADIFVQVWLGRDRTSSWSNSRYTAPSSSVPWPSYLDEDTATFYGSITNYTNAVQRYFMGSRIRIKSFCRRSSCFDCSYSAEDFVSVLTCSPETKLSYGDSVTFVFLDVTDVSVAAKIIANENCYINTALNGIGGNFSMNGTEYHSWFRTTCPPGYLNSSNSVLSCSEPARIFDGGIMFDVDVISNILISSFDVDIHRQVVENKIPQTIYVYYKAGSFLQQHKCDSNAVDNSECSGPIYNLSEWRFIGSMSPDTDLLSETFSLDVSRLVNQNKESGPHFCTGESIFSCSAGQMTLDDWIGSQPAWVQDSKLYMSSKFDKSVNITDVFMQGNSSMWHSGGRDTGTVYDSADNESGCPDLPNCPQNWQYDKNQWLAFDSGVCYTLSRFRTRMPDVAKAPLYKYKEIIRNDRFFSNLTEKKNWWLKAQFKSFSFQYSKSDIGGPWTTVLDGKAEMVGQRWQEFYFQPVTARYWRLLMHDNFGFGYILIEAIELYGSRSIWCQDSAWCSSSLLCDRKVDDAISIAQTPSGNLQQNGIGLSAGVHSFYIRSSLGSGIGSSKRNRGSIVNKDENLIIKEGTTLELDPPFYAWERPLNLQYEYIQVNLDNLAQVHLNGSSVFTVVARFKTSFNTQPETLLMIGDLCNKGLKLQISGVGFILTQGCGISVSSINVDMIGSVLKGQSYCLSLSFTESSLRYRIEQLSPNVVHHSISAVLNSSLYIPEFSTIVIAAASSCGENKFSGILIGVGLYSKEQGEAAAITGCRRTCSSTTIEGSCFESASFKLHQNIITSGAADVQFMRLPSPSLSCFAQFRLQISADSVNHMPWCLQELAIYQSNSPYWQDIRENENISFAVTCGGGNLTECSLAFDGLVEQDRAVSRGNIDPFCSSGVENDWFSVDFGQNHGSVICISGYALLSPENTSKHAMPSSWTLQGSNDGVGWFLIDSQTSVAWRRNTWKRYSAGSKLQPYLFFACFLNTSQVFAYNTNSKLYRWLGDIDGWVLSQELFTRGARKAHHFMLDGDHFLAVASVRDSSVIANAQENGGRATDSQVGSDIFRWTGNSFTAFDTLSTNNSLDIKHFSVDDRDFLISADHRLNSDSNVQDRANTSNTSGSSILFSRKKSAIGSNTSCSAKPSCRSCLCSTMFSGTANSSSLIESGHEPINAFDGDSTTFWRGIYPDLINNISLEWNFHDCSSGAYVAAYSVMTTQKACPISWELQGSDDNQRWDVLSRQSEQSCFENTKPATFILSPRFDQRHVTGSHYEPKLRPYRIYRIVFMNPGWDLEFENHGGLRERAIEISELEFIFLSSSNAALIATYVPWTVTAYDFSAYDIPYSTINHDSDGFTVSGLIETKFNHTGVFNSFDIDFESGARLSNSSNCRFSEEYKPGKFWDDGKSPFLSCTSYWDLCSESFPVCFNGGDNKDTFPSASFSENKTTMQKYRYKISFKNTVRLVSLRMRGCGWCSGTISIFNQDMVMIGSKDNKEISDCSTCSAWRLKVDAIGRAFYLTEENRAPWSLRAAISFDYEPYSEWDAIQLLPTQGASDFEFFSIMQDSFLVVANYRRYDDCYGEFECVNPQGSSPLTENVLLPYDIDSTVYKYDINSPNQLFKEFQSIQTHGALDWEYFVLNRQHYLVVANSFSSITSSPACNSVVYIWRSLTEGFTVFQEIPTYGARSWRKIEKDGSHYLVVANTLHSDLSLLSIALYRWVGSSFVFAGNIPKSAAASLTFFTIHNAVYAAVANIVDDLGEFTTASSIFRWQDSARYLGSIVYSDAFTGSTFVVKNISANTSIGDSVCTINVTLACDSVILKGSVMTIGGMIGSQSESSIVEISGVDAAYFNFSGEWSQKTGSLLLTITSNISPMQNLLFSFEILNGRTFSDSVRPFLSCSGQTNILAQTMSGSILGVSRLADPAFTQRIVSETSSMQFLPDNNVSIKLKANRPISSGALLTVFNLSGVVRSSLNVLVTGPDSNLFQPYGTWESNNIVFTVAQLIQAYTPFSIVFPVTNGPRPQLPTLVSVKAHFPNGSNLIDPVPCNGLILSFKDPPRFQTAIIQGSNNINGSMNTIFVTIQAGVPLATGARITIVGLIQPYAKNGDAVLLRGAPRDLYKVRARKAILMSSTFSSSVDSLVFQINETISNAERIILNFELMNFVDRRLQISPQISITACLTRDNPGYGSLSASTSCELGLEGMVSPGGMPSFLSFSNSTNVSELVLRGSEFTETYHEFEQVQMSELTVEMWVMVTRTDPSRSGPIRKKLLSVGNSILVGYFPASTESAYSILFNFSSVQNAGQWFHITARWSSSTGYATNFVNGAVSATTVDVLKGELLSLSGTMRLGSLEQEFGARVAQVRMWSLALNDEDIIWSSGKPSFGLRFLQRQFIPRALLAYYTFDSDGNDTSTYKRVLNISSLTVTKTFPSGLIRLNEYIYPSSTLKNLVVTSRNRYPSADNCINISFTCSIALGPGTRLLMYGLFGSQTSLQSIPIHASSGSLLPVISSGVWNNSQGVLVLTLDYPIQSNSLVSLSFALINNHVDQPGQIIQMSIQDGLIWSYGDVDQVVGKSTISGQALETNSTVFRAECVIADTAPAKSAWRNGICTPDISYESCPLFKANSWANSLFPRPCDCAPVCPMGMFKTPVCTSRVSDFWRPSMYVTDSGSLPQEPNYITFTIRPDRLLPAGSMIRIKGLTGTITSDRLASSDCLITDECFLLVSGPMARKFVNSSGSWTRNSGGLTLYLQSDMDSFSDVQFSIQITNGLDLQEAVMPTIEVIGKVFIPETRLCGRVLKISQRIVEWARFAESNCMKCQQNAIKITILTNSALPSGTNITIANMTGLLMQSGTVALRGIYASKLQDYQLRARTGYWDSAHSKLMLQSRTAFGAGETIRFEFTVLNGFTEQQAISPMISIETANEYFVSSMSGNGLSFRGNTNYSNQFKWMATGWFLDNRWLASSAHWLKRATGSCCIGACCSVQSCCSCADLLGSSLPEFSVTGTYFPGSACEKFCDRRIYVYGGASGTSTIEFTSAEAGSDLWNDVTVKNHEDVIPVLLNYSYLYATLAEFGPKIAQGNVQLSGQIVVASPLDACDDLHNLGAAGKILLIVRGDCEFTSQIRKAQYVGAIAAVVFNNVLGQESFVMQGSAHDIEIPALMMSYTDGITLQDAAASSMTITFPAYTYSDPLSSPKTRIGHTIVSASKRIYLFGGEIIDGNALNVCEFNDHFSRDFWIFDPISATWSNITDPRGPDERCGHSAVVTTPSMLTTEDTFVFGDSSVRQTIIFVGGKGINNQVLGDVWSFDPINAVWINQTENLSTPPLKSNMSGSVMERWGHTATALGEKIYIFGGVSIDGSILGDFWLLKVDKYGAPTSLEDLTLIDYWNKCTVHNQCAYPAARWGHSAASVVVRASEEERMQSNNKFYLQGKIGVCKVFMYGGRSTSGNVLDDLWSFDPVKQVWTDIYSASWSVSPPALWGHAAVGAAGRYYIFGGNGGDNKTVNDAWFFNPDTLLWTNITGDPGIGKRWGHAAAASADFLETQWQLYY